jgi:hypothetical protein
MDARRVIRLGPNNSGTFNRLQDLSTVLDRRLLHDGRQADSDLVDRTAI